MGPVKTTVGRVVKQALQELDTKILKWLNTQQCPNTCGGSTEHRRHIALSSDAFTRHGQDGMDHAFFRFTASYATLRV